MSAFRIHPSIGVARIGNSADYVIAPETMAGQPDPRHHDVVGGLPIRAETGDLVTSSDLRDAEGALKRHAARFRIFVYDDHGSEAWPRGDGVEVTIGSKVDGKTVAKIIWTVHVANKKANWFCLREDKIEGIASFENGLPNIRNPGVTKSDIPQPDVDKRIAVLDDPARVAALTIDPGPRTIEGGSGTTVAFDTKSAPTVFDPTTGTVKRLLDYPVKFPDFDNMELPAGPIDTLGELKTDASGRLLVLGGYGRAAGWTTTSTSSASQKPPVQPIPLQQDVNNDQWFDDTSDGPVSAILIFDDGSSKEAASAWVTTTDPSFAPQILNLVSAWDDIYDCWVRGLDLEPTLFDSATQKFKDDYKPTFEDQIAPIFQSAALQRWVTNMSQHGISAHARLADIKDTDDPRMGELAGIHPIFRNPFEPDTEDSQRHISTTLMPLSLGDGYEAFLTLRKTQYFCLTRWNAGLGSFQSGAKTLGPGEYLDKAVLVNCLGGRFSPGIDVTFVVREPTIYVQPWQNSGSGPFRIKRKSLNYFGRLDRNKPLLTAGYVPIHRIDEGLEPGDLGKFMAVPWHTDYNSCATHPPYPNPPGNRKVFWSWPAQRPVAVNLASDVRWLKKSSDPHEPEKLDAVLGTQRWSVRGFGTDAPEAEKWGRYQQRVDMLDNWDRIGVVLQSNRIADPALTLRPGVSAPPGWFLETQGLIRDTGRTPVVAFPNFATYLEQVDDLADAPSELDRRELFYQLLNIGKFRGVLDDARAFVDWWLKQAEELSNRTDLEDEENQYFEYSDQAFQDRLDLVYNDLADIADNSDPADPTIAVRSRADAIERIRQFAPFNLLDGAWLRNIGRAGPQDEVHALLFSVWMDELGDADVAMHHCNIYRDLCQSVGYAPPPINSKDFAFDQTLLDSAFEVPAFELAISQFTDEYLPEIIGMTLQLEWGVLELKPTRDIMSFWGINPHFYVMHIGIDNAVNGHGQRAADAVRLYLGQVRDSGGEAAMQRAWRRIWNGYVAFGAIGSFGDDLTSLLEKRRQPQHLRKQLVAMIGYKAQYGSLNHQRHALGETLINEWFADPAGFLDALAEHGYLTAGNWQDSRLRQLLEFQTGPMYRVFTDDEVALWETYTNSLGKPVPPIPPAPPLVSRQMADVIDALRPQQQGTLGHRQLMLADDKGVAHTIEWWFGRPTVDFMKALADPRGGYVVPGHPELSPLSTSLVVPTGPMGPVFDQLAPDGSGVTCRQVLHLWIAGGCDLPSRNITSLGLSTPASKRARHRTGRVRGMGSRH